MTRWGLLSDNVQSGVRGAFGWIGLRIGRHPSVSLLIGVLITMYWVAQLSNLELSSDEGLFQPHSTIGWKDRERILKTYGSFGTGNRETNSAFMASVGASVRITESSSVLDKAILLRLFDLHHKILVNRGAADIAFARICMQRSSGDTAAQIVAYKRDPFDFSHCPMGTLFDMLNITSRALLDDMSQDAIDLAIGALPDRVFADILSGLELSTDTPRRALHANALLFFYQGATDPRQIGLLQDWEGRFITLCEAEYAAAPPLYRLDYWNSSGYEVETLKLVSTEFPLMIGTILIILVYMVMILGKRPFLHSRMLLGIVSITTVLCSLLISFGASVQFGVAITVLSPIVVFVLLGVGVDDMIIITDSFDLIKEMHPSWDIPEIMSEALHHAGNAITITSLTTFTGLMIASNMDFPAVSAFCYTAALGILAVFITQITLFAGFLVLDERRMRANRYDVCPCFVAPRRELGNIESAIATKSAGDHAAVSADASTGELETRCAAVDDSDGLDSGEDGIHDYTAIDGVIRHVLSNGFAPVLSRRRWQVGIITVFLLWAAFSAYNGSKISTATNLVAFFSPDSYIRLYFENVAMFFSNNKQDLYFCFEDIAFDDPVVHANMRDLQHKALAIPIVYPPIRFWLDDLEAYANYTRYPGDGVGRGAQFFELLVNFTNFRGTFKHEGKTISNSQVLTDVVLDHRRGIVTDARFSLRVAFSLQVSERISDTAELRSLLARSSLGGPNSYVWMTSFSDADRDKEMPRLIITNLSMTALGVTLSLLLLVHPSVVALIFGTIVLVDVDLLGLMQWWGQSLDLSAFIALAMSIGLSVDYILHFSSHFVSSIPRHVSAKRRLKRTFYEMGTSVFNGGLSTFLGILLLALAKSPGFLTFFRIMFGVVLFGLVHGLVFAPAVLTLIWDRCGHSNNVNASPKQHGGLASIDIVKLR